MHRNNKGRGAGCGYSNSGPLMTDHLQVRNLDRELEILRHKRELVQMEQQMLSMECNIERKRQFGEPNHNVSDMFDNVWQPPPPKRSNISRQMNPWRGDTQGNTGRSMSKPMPTNYIPSLLSKKIDPPFFPTASKPVVHPMFHNTVAQRPLRPNIVRKDFRPTQVTKKKPKDPPNKLNSYPVKARQDLVSKATASLSATNKTNEPPEDPETMILREDRVPSKQVTGRLELALGSIVKEMRISNDQDDIFKKMLSNKIHQRSLKQVIRERIRAIMLNKPVGSLTDIVNMYREKFPKQSDKDIIDVVLESESPTLVNYTKTDSPEEFFEKNISFILEKKIQEMSVNLLKMYGNVRRSTTLDYTKTNNMSKLDKVGENEPEYNNEMAMNILRAITGKYVTVEERNVLTKYYTKLIEDILERKIPEYLPQCTEQFLKIFDLDRQFKAVKIAAIKRVREEIITKETLDLVSKKEATNTDTPDNIELITKDNSAYNEIKEEVDKESSKEETIDVNYEMEKEGVTGNDKIEKDEVIKKNENITENICSREITTITDKVEANKLVEAENLSSTPITTTLLPEKMESSSTTLKPKESQVMLKVAPSTPSIKELPYYVKLIGRPKLPNRAAICDFLNNFQPTSIKKHKTINNLLVVGFINQEDYNKILTANETIIGDITIIIKASEKINTGKENEAISKEKDVKNITQKNVDDDKNDDRLTDDVKQEVNDGVDTCKDAMDSGTARNEEDDKDFIGKELDNQISDLLTTIQESDKQVMEISESEDNCNKSNNSLEADCSQESDKLVKRPLEAIQEFGHENNENAQEEVNKVVKSSKSNVKESGRATPVRSSSRLANVTPSTIRTRRASRLMQE